MQALAIVDHALVDTLHTVLGETPTAHIVGPLSDGARERLARSLPGGLSTAEPAHPSLTRHETVVVLDARRLDEGLAAVRPDGMLAVAAINPGYGAFLLEILEGARPSCGTAADLESVRVRLEADGWTVTEATPVAVPLALIPFDPARIPKTVLAYLYARHPEIETYCFLVRARRNGSPARDLGPPEPSRVHFPTLPWKTEAEWSEEAAHRMIALPDGRARNTPRPGVGLDEAGAQALGAAWGTAEALRVALARSDDELSRIKSSLTWRAIVAYRTARERLLPPHTWRGRLYDSVRSAVRRLGPGR
jgi:hypothetical protein